MIVVRVYINQNLWSLFNWIIFIYRLELTVLYWFKTDFIQIFVAFWFYFENLFNLHNNSNNIIFERN